MKHFLKCACMAIACAISFAINAAENAGSEDADTEATPGYKIGYSTRPAFGGPNSPEGQLEEDDRIKEPAFRFPRVYGFFEPWRDWKRRLNEEHGFQLTGHYSTLYQGASDSLSGEDQASSGFFRTTAKWTLTGRGTPNTGSLVFMLDHRHAYRDIAPSSLAGQVGYNGLTGTLYSDQGWVIPNFNWQQGLNDGNTGLLIGRYDPNDYMNILGYSNPWTSFSNLSILFDSSVVYPDSSWGLAGGHWFNDQVYVMGGVNDGNGTLDDGLEFFDGGAEFYTWGHVGWTPSKADRYYSNVHMLLWHVDAREDAGTDSAQGVNLAASWTFDRTWMTFFRAGWSEGSAPIYNTSVTAGLIRKFHYRSDWAGIGFNWGDSPDDSLPDQKTMEAFWNFQFAQNFAITPSVQLLVDPAQNTEEDQIWVVGLRTRITF